MKRKVLFNVFDRDRKVLDEKKEMIRVDNEERAFDSISSWDHLLRDEENDLEPTANWKPDR